MKSIKCAGYSTQKFIGYERNSIFFLIFSENIRTVEKKFSKLFFDFRKNSDFSVFENSGKVLFIKFFEKRRKNRKRTINGPDHNDKQAHLYTYYEYVSMYGRSKDLAQSQ